MVPKTERFELRLDPSVLDRVDEWRSEQDDMPSRAEAVRRLLEDALRSSRSTKPFALDKPQKLIVWLLTEMLKHQKDYEEQDTINLIQDAIYGGHFWALDMEMVGVLHDHVHKRSDVTFVIDVLDMWSFIEESYAKFSDADKARVAAEAGALGSNPQFIGFDGNNESDYMSIAQFLVNKMGRFQSFKGRRFNSHSPTVARYGAMYRVFEPIRTNLIGRGLNAAEVVQILNALIRRI